MQKAQREKQLAEQKAQREKQLAEQKAQREKQKAEWDAQLKRIQGFCDDGQFDVARTAIEKILRQGTSRCDSALYALAAGIYLKNKDHDTALQYINEAIALEPDDIYDNVLKGRILGKKALRLANSSDFRSSSGQRQQYRALRNQELAVFETACHRAEDRYNKDPDDSDCKSEFAYALGHLGYALYFRADRLDEQKAGTERYKGAALADMARTYVDHSIWYIQDVLDAWEKGRAAPNFSEKRGST